MVLVAGLALVNSTWSVRFAGLAAGIGLWLTTGVLWPYAIKQLDYNSLGAALFVVVGGWLAYSFMMAVTGFRSHRPRTPTSAPLDRHATEPDANATPTKPTLNEERRDV
jgi:hypothetical protein